MRTQQEIIERFEQRTVGDLLGFEIGEYRPYLDYEYVKPYLKEGVTEVEWEPYALKNVINRMEKYMSFAWDKANNCRGISATRSVQHYIAWIWLSGDDDFAKEIEQDYELHYCHYGKPILEKICNHYGWDWKQWDDGTRTNTEY